MALPKIEVEVRADTKSATASLDAFVKELDQVGQAGETAGKDIDELKRNFDRLRGSIDPVYSSSKNYERAVRTVSAAVKSGAVSQGEANRVLKLAEAQYLTTGRSAQVMGTQVRGANHHATNMMFQFQDIGMMLASGQSPFLLAMQQGTQVTGIMQQMRAQGQSAFKAITGGIRGMINPMSIATLGIIAGGAALGQWALSAISAGDEAEDLAERMDEVRESTKNLNEELRSMRLGVTAEELAIMDSIKAKTAEISKLEEWISNNRRASTIEHRRKLKLAKMDKQELVAQLNELRNLQRAKNRLEETTRELANAERAIWQTSKNVSAEAENLVKEIGMAATRALVLADVDITSPISSATKEAAQLAAKLGIALSAAISLQNLRSSMEYSGRGGDPRKFGDPFGRTDNGSGQLSQDAQSLIGAANKVSGGGGRADPNTARIQSLIESLKTEREILEEWRVEGMELLREANAQELEALGGHNEAKLRLEQEYQERLAQLQGEGRSQQLKDAGSFFGAMASAIQQGGGKAVKAAQVLAAAQGLINSYLAYTEVLKDPSFVGRPWARMAAAASVLGAGLNMVQAIKGVSSSGASGGGATSTVGGEAQNQPRRQSVTNITLQGEVFSRESVEALLVEQLQGEIDRGGRVVFSS